MALRERVRRLRSLGLLGSLSITSVISSILCPLSCILHKSGVAARKRLFHFCARKLLIEYFVLAVGACRRETEQYARNHEAHNGRNARPGRHDLRHACNRKPDHKGG